MACEHVARCSLVPQLTRSSALKVWKILYCELDHHRCERRPLFGKGQAVSPDLLPDGGSLAELQPRRRAA